MLKIIIFKKIKRKATKGDGVYKILTGTIDNLAGSAVINTYYSEVNSP